MGCIKTHKVYTVQQRKIGEFSSPQESLSADKVGPALILSLGWKVVVLNPTSYEQMEKKKIKY